MTIPINPVSIHPPVVDEPRSPWAMLLMQALEHRQELELAKKKLEQEQQQFELTKRLAGTQEEGAKLVNLQRQQQLKATEDDIAARDQALQLFTGNIPRLHDVQGLGEVMAGVKDARVAGHLLQFLGDAQRVFTQPQGQNFTSIGQTPEGRPVLLETHTGRTQVGGPQLRQPGGSVALTQKVKIGARNAANAIRQAIALVQRDPDANRLPVISEVAGSAAESKLGAWVPGLSGAAGAMRRRSMSPNQNKFQNLLNIVAHNAVGLLPGSRQSLVLFQNLRESYATGAGDPPELRAQKLALLQDLGNSLNALAEGQDVSLAHLPGFEDFQPFDLSSSPPPKARANSPAPAPIPAPAGTIVDPSKYFRP